MCTETQLNGQKTKKVLCMFSVHSVQWEVHANSLAVKRQENPHSWEKCCPTECLHQSICINVCIVVTFLIHFATIKDWHYEGFHFHPIYTYYSLRIEWVVEQKEFPFCFVFYSILFYPIHKSKNITYVPTLWCSKQNIWPKRSVWHECMWI